MRVQHLLEQYRARSRMSGEQRQPSRRLQLAAGVNPGLEHLCQKLIRRLPRPRVRDLDGRKLLHRRRTGQLLRLQQRAHRIVMLFAPIKDGGELIPPADARGPCILIGTGKKRPKHFPSIIQPPRQPVQPPARKQRQRAVRIDFQRTIDRYRGIVQPSAGARKFREASPAYRQ
jgi:hypothetical protein